MEQKLSNISLVDRTMNMRESYLTEATWKFLEQVFVAALE